MIHSFFEEEVPLILSTLKEEDQAVFGTMNAGQMLDHLLGSLKLTYGLIDVQFVIPEEKFEKARAFLHSSKAILPGAQKPIEYDSLEEQNGVEIDLNIKKRELLNELTSFLQYVKENPEVNNPHPYFGYLNGADWMAFQKKHFEHHFRQFNLLKEQ